MPSFRIKLHKTYFSMGFFNVPVDADCFFGNHDQPISIIVEPEQSTIQGKINRTANTNKTARIIGTVRLRDWFQDNFVQGDMVEVEIKSPQLIHIRKM